jgi:hypothetical protein
LVWTTYHAAVEDSSKGIATPPLSQSVSLPSINNVSPLGTDHPSACRLAVITSPCMEKPNILKENEAFCHIYIANIDNNNNKKIPYFLVQKTLQ